jgi:UDP-hydrolysing UDP-N-acetyl-D-glucosamine 2-epimerase
VLVDRANYGRLQPVLRAIAGRDELELQVLCAGTMVLERFHRPVENVRQDGFAVHGEVYMELEGSTPMTMAKSIGLGIVEFSNEYHRLNPDIVLIIGDRYEALAATIAAAYMNICVAHVQGGEISGSIDESTRHAITKFSHYHFPSTKRAAEFLMRMGERSETILGVGCPSSDIAFGLDSSLDPCIINSQGNGISLDLAKPFLLTVFHPTTTEYGRERTEMERLLDALHELRIQTLMLWPNIDAGSDHISKAVRIFRDRAAPDWLRILTNLRPREFLLVLSRSACAVGNSSSFVRDASYFGTPIVLVGGRQKGRERGEHVTAVPVEKQRIVDAVRKQLAHGRYSRSTLYGDGSVAQRIAASLASLELYTQKQLHYREVIEE